MDNGSAEVSGGKSAGRIVWNDTLSASKELAVPVGVHQPVLAKLVDRTSSD